MPKVAGDAAGSYASVSVPVVPGGEAPGLRVTFTSALPADGPQDRAPEAETSRGNGEPRDLEGPAPATLLPPPGRIPFAPPQYLKRGE